MPLPQPGPWEISEDQILASYNTEPGPGLQGLLNKPPIVPSSVKAAIPERSMLVLQTVNAVRVPTVLLGSIQSGALESLEERTTGEVSGTGGVQMQQGKDQA